MPREDGIGIRETMTARPARLRARGGRGGDSGGERIAAVLDGAPIRIGVGRRDRELGTALVYESHCGRAGHEGELLVGVAETEGVIEGGAADHAWIAIRGEIEPGEAAVLAVRCREAGRALDIGPADGVAGDWSEVGDKLAQ